MGNRDLVRLGVIEMMRGNSGEGATGGDACGLGRSCNDDTTGGDDCGVILGKGGMSHGRGIRSNEDGVIFLVGGNRISSGVGDLFHGAGITGVASLCSGDGVSDWGNGMSMGSSITIGGGLYVSIDEYSCRCDPQGTKGSGGVSTWGDSTSGGLGGVGMNGGANGDRSTRGGDGSLGTTGGRGMSPLGRDDDGWMNSWMTGTGPVGDSGLIAGADDSGSGIMVVALPVPPEGPGLGMNTGDGDLLLIVLL